MKQYSYVIMNERYHQLKVEYLSSSAYYFVGDRILYNNDFYRVVSRNFQEVVMDFDKLTDILTILAVLATAGVVWITVYILNGGMI